MRAPRAAIDVGLVAGAAIVGTVACRLLSGDFMPNAAIAQALVYGALDALFAIGLVLVYRAGRIINFAQASLGILGAMLFLMLTAVEGWPFLLAFPAALAVAC